MYIMSEQDNNNIVNIDNIKNVEELQETKI